MQNSNRFKQALIIIHRQRRILADAPPEIDLESVDQNPFLLAYSTALVTPLNVVAGASEPFATRTI